MGIGTGISSQPFAERGFTVLGIEPDERMASLARSKGLAVETGRFEDWDPAGRVFDSLNTGLPFNPWARSSTTPVAASR